MMGVAKDVASDGCGQGCGIDLSAWASSGRGQVGVA